MAGLSLESRYCETRPDVRPLLATAMIAPVSASRASAALEERDCHSELHRRICRGGRSGALPATDAGNPV
jgi:hypothetical protein